MATLFVSLWVKAGTITINNQSIPFWGLARINTGPKLPGPILEVKVNDNIRIRLNNSFVNINQIGESIGLMFPGMEGVLVEEWPVGNLRPVQPQYINGELVSFTDYVENGSMFFPSGLLYRFQAKKPGIYLYESGVKSEKQIQMGVYGVINIKPIGYNIPSNNNYKTAYGAGTNSRYDVEKVLVMGEIDTIMHENVVPEDYYNMLDFKPNNWILNGREYPHTINSDNNFSQPYGSRINCKVNDRVLLRIVNAGYEAHTFYFGGLIGRVIAEDSYPLVTINSDLSYEKSGITLAPGQAADVIIIPTTKGEYYLYDRDYNHIVNEDTFPGGMVTRMVVS